MMVIVMAGHGHLSGLWRLRLWFVYTVLCLAFRDLVDNVVSRYVPIKSPLHALSPKATKLGFLAGGAAAFFFYYQVRFHAFFIPLVRNSDDQHMVVRCSAN